VANETIRIIEEDNLVAHAAKMGVRMLQGLRQYESHPLVAEVRGVGLIAAIELVTNKETKVALEKPGQLGAIANAKSMEAGFFTRNMADAMAFCPPLVINESEIDDLVGRVGQALLVVWLLRSKYLVGGTGMQNFLVLSLVASIILTILINVLPMLFPKSSERVERKVHEKMEGNQPRVRVFFPWKAMLIASLVLTVVVNLVGFFAAR